MMMMMIGSQEYLAPLQRSYMMKNYASFAMMNNATASLFLVVIVLLAMTVHRGEQTTLKIFICLTYVNDSRS